MLESTPSRFRHFPHLARCAAALLVLPALLFPAACTYQPFDQREPFSRDRMGAVRRSAQLTIGTLESAADATLSAFDSAERLCIDPGESLDIAYATARGDQSAARGRQQSFARRVATTSAGGEALFEEWRAEIRKYHDDAVAQSSRESLERLQTSFAKLMAALVEVRDELGPVLGPIEDRVLYLKHSRNEGLLATRPALTPFIADRFERIRQGVENARQAGAEFETATAGD